MGIIFSVFIFPWMAASEDTTPVLEIHVIGNKTTRENIILRELTFEVGDIITYPDLNEKIERSRNNLLNTRLFNFVEITYQNLTDGIIVKISVVERWYIWPVPIFEHADRNLPAWLRDPEFERLNYGAFLNWNNFRGRKEFLSLKARFGYREQFALGYNKPNLDQEQKHGFSINLNKFRQHEAQIGTEEDIPVFFRESDRYLLETASASLGYIYRPGLYQRHAFFVNYNESLFSNDSLRNDFLGFDESRKSRWVSLNYMLDLDYRDSRPYPLEGFWFNLNFLRRGLGLFDDFEYGKNILSLTGSYHNRLLPRLYHEHAAKVRLTRDEYLPVLFREGLGYSTTLRGFEYYTIEGNSYFINVNALRYELLPQTDYQLKFVPWKQFNKIHFSLYANLFFDMAYIENDFFNHNSNNLGNTLLYSSGLGIDLVTYYDQVYRFEVTRNSLSEWGIYIHLEVPFSRW